MRRKLGTVFIIVSAGGITSFILLSALSVVLHSLLFDTTLIDSCTLGNSQETIRAYYHATILDGSYTVTYQPRPNAQTLMIVASRTYPEIVGVECSNDSVRIHYSDPNGPNGDQYTEELSRDQFLETYVYYDDSEKSIQPYTHQPLLQKLLFHPYSWLFFLVLLLIIGLNLRRSKQERIDTREPSST